MPWKPIDLAPRDGTVILACAPPEGADTWTAAQIWAAPKAVSWRPYQAPAGHSRATWRDSKGLACAPTYFMPLPEPPAIDDPVHGAPLGGWSEPGPAPEL